MTFSCGREDLSDIVKRLVLVIPPRPPVSAFGAIFFDGTCATVYDGEVAASALCDLELYGGIDGKLLDKWLGTCSGETIKVEVEEQVVVFRCGRSRMKSALLDPEMMVFEQPKNPGTPLMHPLEIIEKMRTAAPFMGNDRVHTWRRGLTLLVDKGQVDLYATDNVTMVHEHCKFEGEDSTLEAVLSPRFIILALAFSFDLDVEALEIADGWAQISFVDESMVFTRTGLDISVDGYKDIIDSLYGEAGDFFPITEEIIQAVSGVSEILKFTEEQECCLEISGNDLIVRTSDKAKAFAETPVDLGSHGHEDILVWVTARELIRVLLAGTHMALTRGAVVSEKEGITALVATAITE